MKVSVELGTFSSETVPFTSVVPVVILFVCVLVALNTVTVAFASQMLCGGVPDVPFMVVIWMSNMLHFIIFVVGELTVKETPYTQAP